MAHFMAKIKGNRGEASRLGSKDSGIVATVNGWECGIRVLAAHRDGKDIFEVYKTSGSNGRTRSTYVGTFYDGEVEG